MKAFYTTCLLASSFFFVSNGEQQQQHLRSRELQGYIGDQRCDNIESLFNETVSCECNRIQEPILRVTKTWDCEFDGIQCQGDNCALPTYKGTTIIQPSIFEPVRVKSEICAYNYTNEIQFPNQTFPDVCLDVDVCFDFLGRPTVCSCGGKVNDMECTACEPCLFGFGMRIECEGFPFPLCIPIVTPFGAAGSATTFIPGASN